MNRIFFGGILALALALASNGTAKAAGIGSPYLPAGNVSLNAGIGLSWSNIGPFWQNNYGGHQGGGHYVRQPHFPRYGPFWNHQSRPSMYNAAPYGYPMGYESPYGYPMGGY